MEARLSKGAARPGVPERRRHIENLANIIARGLIPMQIAAGVCTIVKDDEGKVVLDCRGEPARKAKYEGMHALRAPLRILVHQQEG
jgi:hypothetical protein